MSMPRQAIRSPYKRPRLHGSGVVTDECTWCGRVGRRGRAVDSVWPYVCADCLAPIAHVLANFKTHHVPLALARAFALSPRCMECGVDISGRHPRSGRVLAQVDHDHRCCGPNPSCGRCVRGIVCGSCNVRRR